MAWNIESVESKSIVFVCAKCGSISTNLNKCSNCNSKDLVECDLIEETPEHYIIDVDSLDTVVALSRSNSVTGITPSNQRTHIVTVSRSDVSFKDVTNMIASRNKGFSIGHISNWVDIWNKLHK